MDPSGKKALSMLLSMNIFHKTKDIFDADKLWASRHLVVVGFIKEKKIQN